MAQINISRESDEVEEMICEYCFKHGNRSQPAEGFCVDCVKYFCATCLNYHQTFLPDHVQQDKDSMPTDVYLEECKQHPEELIKFYCLSCEDTACSTCKTTFHKQCEEVHHLPKLASEYEKEKECNDIENSIDLLEKKMAGIAVIINNGRQNTEQYHADAKNTIRKQKEEVESIFNNSEQEIHTSNKNLLDTEEKSKDLLKRDIKNLKTEIDRLKNSSKKCMVFLKMKSVKEERKHILEKLDGLEICLQQISKYRYNPASRMLEPNGLGNVTVERHREEEVHKIPKSARRGLKPDSLEKETAKPHREVELSETQICIALLVLAFSFLIFSFLILSGKIKIPVQKLSSIVQKLPSIELHFNPALLYYQSGSRLLIFDRIDKLHVYNPKGSNWSDTTKIKATPNEITKVNADMTALYYHPNNVNFFEVSSNQQKVQGKFVKLIDIGTNCQFIQYRQGKLFALREDTLTIFDDFKNEWNNYFIESVTGIKAEGMAVSHYGSIIYISEKNKKTITGYTTEGKVIANYKNECLKDPRKMTMDNKGNLFVCGYSSHNIFYVSADLTYGFEILNESHGIYHPDLITYNERESILYISSTSSKSIQVYKINATDSHISLDSLK